MDLYNRAFEEGITQNLQNEEKWNFFRNESLKTSDNLNYFLKHCQFDIMVPVGKKAFLPGKLQHTNDILMSHNSQYFSLMSANQADEIIKSRVVVCDARLKALKVEQDLFRGKLDVPKQDVFSEQEIIEEYNEQEEVKWREKHRESVKRSKLLEAQERERLSKSNEDLDDLFDQYEMLEEMANELVLLENEKIDEEMLKKLITGDVNIPSSKKRIAHSSENKIHQEETQEISRKNKLNKKKKGVRFSNNLENVKIIETPGAKTSFPPIQIAFTHSSGKFHPSPDEPEIISHPGDFLKYYKTLTSTGSTEATKSILKIKNSPEECKNISEMFSSALTIGDVIENPKQHIVENSEPTRKVSRFKEMRLKSKS